MKLFILSIIILLFYFIIYKKENYTVKLNDVSFSTCGTLCTEGLNCSGFGYKPMNKSCYLSKKTIFGKPYDEPYINEYSKLDKRCNKINKILDDDLINDDAYAHNSVYSCSDGEKNVPNLYQIVNYGSTFMNEKDISEKVKYKTHYIDWKKTIIPNKLFISKTYKQEDEEKVEIEYNMND